MMLASNSPSPLPFAYRAVAVCSIVFSAALCAAQAGNPTAPAAPSQGPAERQSGKQEAKPAAGETGKASATTNVNSSQVKTGHAVADRGDLPPTVPAGRPVIGLALEGGGAVGLAHIGVLKWMEENRVPVDRITGTSMGALVAALYASGKRPDELVRIVTTVEFHKLFYLRAPYQNLSFRRREDERDFPEILTLGLKGGPSFRNALISDSALNDFLNANFFRYINPDQKFDSFPIPFRCVSTDLNTMQRVVFEGGPLPQAVRASISIPGVFAPVEYKDHYLIDGAVVDNLPTDIVRQDLHSDVVIGVHLAATNFQQGDVSSVFGVLSRAFSAALVSNVTLASKQADTLVDVDSSKFGSSDYDKAAELIQAGYQAAVKHGDALRKYSLSEADWAEYLQSRDSRIRPQPALMQIVKVEGSSPGAQTSAAYQFHNLDHKPMEPEPIRKAMGRITGNNTDQATYETFQPQQPNTAPAGSPTQAIVGQQPDTGLRIRLSPVKRGPPFLYVGLDGTSSTNNVSRGTIDFRLLQTGLGGYGSELRTDIRLGFLTQVSSQYYHQFTPSGYFAQLQGGVLRQPVYLWRNQQRISEHLQQQAGGGVQVGRTFNRYLQASLDYMNQVVRWHPVLGADGTAPISGDTQTATAHFKLDTTLSGRALGTGGIRMELRAGGLFNTVASRNAPLVEFTLNAPIHLGGGQSVGIGVQAKSYFRRNVAEPLRFTLGGPLRLSASSIDEYRGTDMYLVRAGYSHRVLTLPSGLGEGVYLAGGYEAGEIWSPERRAQLRQDGVVTLIGVTPIGDLTFGGAVGDAGRRKVFVTFGRIF